MSWEPIKRTHRLPGFDLAWGHLSVLILLASILFASPLRAQLLDPVTYSVTSAPSSVKAGDPFTITVTAKIDGKWHLYSILNDPDAGPYPTSFDAVSEGLFLAAPPRESEAVIAFDPNFEAELGWHSGAATFSLPLAFDANMKGPQNAEVSVFYQVCDDVSCLPPKRKRIPFQITVEGVSDAALTRQQVGSVDPRSVAAPAGRSASSGTGVMSSDLSEEGLFSFLWIAVTAGFAALLTPCVFPMIPLTVSFFTKQSEAGSGSTPGASGASPSSTASTQTGVQAGATSGVEPTRRPGQGRAVRQALLFGFWIVATFTLLGALLALFIGVSGANQFASNPWVNLFIGLVLVAFGISLLGFFELRLPYTWTNWLNRQSNEKSGILGILFMALTISAVSFSCTAPFIGAVLAATAGGEWFYPILGMIGFSAAFASPFVLFAIFPDWLTSLPKSGSWMNLVKVLLGFIELAAAFKFISNADLVWQWGLISRPFTIASWIALFLLASFYVLGVYALPHEKRPESITPGRVVLAFPFLLFSVYLIPGLLGASLGIWDAFLPPKQATDVSVVMSLRASAGAAGGASSGAYDESEWSGDIDASYARARSENKLVFIDFTGYTCTNCRAMETNVFPLASVRERFARFEKVKLYTDDGVDGPENQRFQFELTGTVALPTYAIVDPHTGRLLELLVGYVEASRFESFLDKGLDRSPS